APRGLRRHRVRRRRAVRLAAVGYALGSFDRGGRPRPLPREPARTARATARLIAHRARLEHVAAARLAGTRLAPSGHGPMLPVPRQRRAPRKDRSMRSTKQRTLGALALVATMALGACSGMTPRERDTAVGAAVGGAAGAVMTDGVLGTVGGAAVGGVIGNQVGKHRHER